MLVFILLVCFIQAAFGAIKWKADEGMDSLPQELQAFTVTNMNGTFYAFGGCLVDSVCYNTMYSISPGSLIWEKVKTSGFKPEGRGGHTAVGIGKDIYIYGGYNEHRTFGDIFRFDTQANRWSKGVYHRTIPHARSNHAATSDGLGSFYVHGGYLGEGTYSAEMFLVDPSPKGLGTADVGTFHVEFKPVEAATAVPPPRELHSLTYMNETLYVFGGHVSGYGVQPADFWRYNIKSNGWSRIPVSKKNPDKRAGHGMVQVGSSLYLFGGCDPTAHINVCMDDTWMYSTSKHQWEMISSGSTKADKTVNPIARWKFGMQARGGLLYVFMGSNVKGRPFRDTWWVKVDEDGSSRTTPEEDRAWEKMQAEAREKAFAEAEEEAKKTAADSLISGGNLQSFTQVKSRLRASVNPHEF